MFYANGKIEYTVPKRTLITNISATTDNIDVGNVTQFKIVFSYNNAQDTWVHYFSLDDLKETGYLYLFGNLYTVTGSRTVLISINSDNTLKLYIPAGGGDCIL